MKTQPWLKFLKGSLDEGVLLVDDILLNKYITLLEEDKKKTGSYCRYPVRFVILPFTMLGTDLATKCLKLGAEILELSSLLKKDDGWIDSTLLLDAIKAQKKDKDIVVMGFSELVRFYKKSEFESLLISLITDIENSKENASRRIFIFCYGLYDQIYKLCNERHNRLKFFNPLIFPEFKEEMDYIKLYFTDNSSIAEFMDIQLSTVRSWLSIWKRINNIEYPLVCNSKTLNYWYNYAKPDNVFVVEKLENEKDILHKIFGYNLKSLFLENEKHLWKQLLKDVYKNRSKSLNQLIENVFNINNALNADFIKLWFSSKNEYNKWLLLLFFREYQHLINNIPEYLAILLNSVKSYDDDEFVRTVWMAIFEHERFDLSCQRKDLIFTISNYYNNFDLFENEFKLAFESINDLNIKKELLTATTQFEKKKIIDFYKENIYSMEELTNIYPEFAAYLGQDSEMDVSEENEWIEDYLNHYKQAKIKDFYTEELKQLLLQVNENSNKFYKWYYNHNLEFVNELVKKEKVDRVILLDGVGAEYITLLIHLIRKKKWYIKKALYAKCKLPSTTKYNNYSFDIEKLYIQDFDRDVIHDQYYKSPDSIIKAIDKIVSIFDTYIHLKQDEIVAIIADHGCTALHRLVMSSKTYDYQDAEHDGRCLLCKDNSINENEHYIVYKNTDYDERWVIALKDVSLCNRSAFEVHGGATPEEVIVPFILVTKEEILDIDYKVKPINLKVSGLNKKISFKISPKPKEKPRLTDGFGNEYSLIYNNGVWEAELKEAGKQKITVSVGLKNTTFDIKSTLEEDDLF